jgi:hypothetical protein
MNEGYDGLILGCPTGFMRVEDPHPVYCDSCGGDSWTSYCEGDRDNYDVVVVCRKCEYERDRISRKDLVKYGSIYRGPVE